MTSHRAYYSAPIVDFLTESPDAIIGKITKNHSQNIEHLQTGAWLQQILIFQQELKKLQEGHILFEVLIPRMGRRADAVIIYRHLIFVIEFKVGAKQYSSQDLRQTHGYALDLNYFHEGSHNKIIIPILVATEADPITSNLYVSEDGVFAPLKANRTGIFNIIAHCASAIARSKPIDHLEWINSKYKPTPTIIEAAQALYANHDVHDISRNDAGAKNLSVTSEKVREIIHSARLRKRKAICFVTGVPGAGKTLVGLNIATSKTHIAQDEHAVFLSGNGPLVEVLREALARDQIRIDKTSTKSQALKRVEQMIQNIHHFRDEYLKNSDAPPENVVIFDEAQRAWDKNSTSKFMNQKRGLINFSQSEPELLISVMDRHTEWCVIIALIGGGQEINTGEAGLNGWIEALSRRFNNWDVYFSDKLSQLEYAGEIVSFNQITRAHSEKNLHLTTSMRSFRAEKLSHMIHYVIHNESTKAFACHQEFQHNFPIKLTRNFQRAKNWLNSKSRGIEKIGLIASSGGLRLKPCGIFVKNRISAADWFLNDADDIRACDFLEDVATEFDIQGLELDWCLVCWDADYRYKGGDFEHWKFTGTTWKKRNQMEQKRFLENAYRVLLTRARQGMVIFIPPGDETDPTRSPSFYDETFSYLRRCGIESIDS